MKRTLQQGDLSPSAKRSNITGLASPPTTPEKQRAKFIDGLEKVKKPVFTSVYQETKKLFRKSCGALDNDFALLSREREADTLTTFLETHVSKSESRSIYVSGPPGTGKTAQVSLSLERLKTAFPAVETIIVNCMTINCAEAVYRVVAERLLNKPIQARLTCDEFVGIISAQTKFQSVVILLDELDNLITKNQQILFELFSLCSILKDKNSSSLILIGIANALDLTDRFLPRLKTNGITPQLLPFLPYTADQIKNIITAKLQSIDSCIVQPAAIQLCSKKVGANTGDLRKAFDIIYRAIEMVENQQSNAAVSISHVAKVCSLVFGNTVSTTLQKLNLQQKIVLVSLLKFQESSKSLDLNSFYQFYTAKIKCDELVGHLGKADFLEVVAALEACSVVALGGKGGRKGIQHQAISCGVPKQEVHKVVSSVGVLNEIMRSSH